MQAYALARPAVRFSLRVLKAKSNQGDFIYAPKKESNVVDAVLKVIGKDCALHCDWTAIETDGFEIHAFLPKPNSTGSKIANEGAFISVDSRPVSASRGTVKQIVAVFKERLRKANPTSGLVRDPFLCMNIICPPDSYDPNIEPAKDDVLFEDERAVVAVVDKLLLSYYPEAVIDVDNMDVNLEEDFPISAQRTPALDEEVSLHCSTSPIPVYEDRAINVDNTSDSAPKEAPRWRLNMYGIDEEDLEFLSTNQPPVIEEEEGRRAANVSNPWTIARMSASIKGKNPVNNGQLLSPAKSQRDVSIATSSPATAPMRRKQPSIQPLTPQTSSRLNMTQASLDDELEQRIVRLAESPQNLDDLDSARRPLVLSAPSPNTHRIPLSRAQNPHADALSPHMNAPGLTIDMIPSYTSSPGRSQRKQQPLSNRHETSKDGRPNDDWFGQPMWEQSAPRKTRRKKPRRAHHVDGPLFPSDTSPGRHCVLGQENRFARNELTSENNTDIRDFFQHDRSQHRRSVSEDPTPGPLRELRGQLTFAAAGNAQSSPHPNQIGASTHHLSRSSSVEPLSRSMRNAGQIFRHFDHESGLEPPDITDQQRADAPHHAPQESSSTFRAAGPHPHSSVTGSTTRSQVHGIDIPPLGQQSEELLDELRSNNVPVSPPKPHDMTARLRAWEDHEATDQLLPTRPFRGPRDAPAHETAPKSCPARRRTTDGAQRSKSSRLPLERVPCGFRIQNMIMPLQVNLFDVIKGMNKTGMMRNILEWGNPSGEDVFDIFRTPTSDCTLDSWALRAAQLLNCLYEQENDVDVFVALRYGIRNALRQVAKDCGDGGVNFAQIQARDSGRDTSPNVELGDFTQIEKWADQVIAARDNSEIAFPRAASAKVGDATANQASTAETTCNNHNHSTLSKKATLRNDVDFNEWNVPGNDGADNRHPVRLETAIVKVDDGDNFEDDIDDDDMMLM